MGLILALVAALCWSGLDAARKRLVGRVQPLTLNVFLALAPLPVFGAWSLVDGLVLAPAYIVPGTASVLCSGLGDVLFLLAVRRASLSLVVPVLSATPVLSLALSGVVNGEVPTAMQWVGAALVVAGGVVLGRAMGRGRGDAHRDELRGLLLMLGVAVLWSASGALDKAALAASDVPTHGVVRAVGVGAVSLGLLFAAGRGRTLAEAVRVGPMLGVACVVVAAAVAIQLVAYDLIFVGVVEAIKRAVGVAGALILGRLMFGEGITRGRLVSAGLMAVGAVLTALGQVQ